MNNARVEDVGLYSLSVDGGGLVLVPGFTLIEFASRCGCDQVLVHPLLLEALTELRAWAGTSVRINSGYRSLRHNKSVGGRMPGDRRKGGSKHLWGMAADVDVMQKTPAQVAEWAEKKKLGGIGRYRTFTHIDVSGKSRRWKG